jgi:hypothetical protein
VVFGENALIIITNWGNAPGSLEGFWLGRGTVFEEVPSIELGPGEQVLIGLGEAPPPQIADMAATEHLGSTLGEFRAAAGEVGLFRSEPFDDPASLAAYVAWGEGEFPIGAVAMAAGLWDESVVTTSEEDPSISTGVFPATTSEDWFTDIGG